MQVAKTESLAVFDRNDLPAPVKMVGKRRALSDFTGAAFRVAAVGGKERIVYDARNGSNLPGTIARKEGDAPVVDIAVNEAYDGSGATYDLYKNIYERNSN